MRVQGRGWAAIAWAPYSRRSEMFARELGGTLHCIHYLRFRSPPHAPFKYALQAVRTLWVLFRERPGAVHVQSPPFVCGLVVAAYCWWTGAMYVVEHHSASFGRMWDWARPLQKLVARWAATNIVTSEHWAALVRSWGGKTLVMYDAFLDLPAGRPFPLGSGPNVAFACTFAEDEPLEAVLGAAARLPEVRFYVTGDTATVPRDALADAPANVTFTGFLDSNGEYLGLLRGVDTAMVLTTRDHTLQLAGCEAIAVGTPLITSEWPYLRTLFSDAAVYVAPTAESIRDGVVDALHRRAQLRRRAIALRRARREQWRAQLAELRGLVPGSPAPARIAVVIGSGERARTEVRS